LEFVGKASTRHNSGDSHELEPIIEISNSAKCIASQLRVQPPDQLALVSVGCGVMNMASAVGEIVASCDVAVMAALLGFCNAY
jgi:hypothetical protein